MPDKMASKWGYQPRPGSATPGQDIAEEIASRMRASTGAPDTPDGIQAEPRRDKIAERQAPPMDMREEYLRRMREAGQAPGLDPMERTRLTNVADTLTGLHQRGGITRPPGGYSLDQLQNLGRVYGERPVTQHPLAMNTGDPQVDPAVMNTLAAAQNARGAQPPPVQIPTAPPPNMNEMDLFPGNDRISRLIHRATPETAVYKFR